MFVLPVVLDLRSQASNPRAVTYGWSGDFYKTFGYFTLLEALHCVFLDS